MANYPGRPPRPKLPEPGCQLLPLLLPRCTTVREEAGDRVCLGKALPYPYPAYQVGCPGSSNAPWALKAQNMIFPK